MRDYALAQTAILLRRLAFQANGAARTGDADSVNARRKLPELASAYFVEIRERLGGDLTTGQMHRMRLASKRFRYTLELFKPCYAAGLQRRLDELRKLQDILGDLNDAVTSAD